MAIKKSELYSSLWASCDELRGGMDASQYKDYVLVLLFMKYISDKYAGKKFAPIKIPDGSGFADMAALKGNTEIGDKINKQIIAPLVEANQNLSLNDFPDFNDATKLGSGKEMVERLTNLIAIYENPVLDFSGNRAEGDDILGDAYEYLMRNFAIEGGRSRGEFYTPAEVSRIMAKVIGIAEAKTTASTAVYDPTCGSGSLLLKVADEATTAVTLNGQEKDATTSGLARMNMILHDNPTAVVLQGNTLADPGFLDGKALKTFDFVVANPPFSDKRWSNGLDPENDDFDRFTGFGVPPGKQGDYAYLLHIIRSLKPKGKGACILPHGVLFRGNAEGEIRRNLIRKGYLKGIIGLPANLFYGTGIPACILVIDKDGAAARKGIFMVDASDGFIKDGNKNRLRARDIHRIVDTFTTLTDIPGFARMVPFGEVEKNEFNLNLPRYIDNRAAEDIQDLDAHLNGGIPERDVENLAEYWQVCPGLRKALFQPNRPDYLNLVVEKQAIQSAIHEHPEFAGLVERMNLHFAEWRKHSTDHLQELEPGCVPKDIIDDLAESLLEHYEGQPLVNHYAIYQHLMDYWDETMQDDLYLIALDGWKADTYRVFEKLKNGKEKDKGWTCDLLPKTLVVNRYFADQQTAIEAQEAELESLVASRTELEEEHSGEEGAFAELEKVNKAEVGRRFKELQGDLLTAEGSEEERKVLSQWLESSQKEAELKKAIKTAEIELDKAAHDQYPKLSEEEIKELAIGDKWMATLEGAIGGELDRISQAITGRVKELADRYDKPVVELSREVTEIESRVHSHLEKMGLTFQ